MIKIMMMKSFSIQTDTEIWQPQRFHSPKGIKLMRYLILNEGKPILNEDLVMYLCTRKGVVSAIESIKTLVCRIRSLLNKISDGLGNCIVSDNSSYKWVTVGDVYIDALEAKAIFEKEERSMDDYDRLLFLYHKPVPERPEWTKMFYDSMESYVKLLIHNEQFNRACEVCEHILKREPDEEVIGVLYQEAIIGRNPIRNKPVIPNGGTMNFSLDAVKNDLSRRWRGAFFCDKNAFRQIYQVGKSQMHFGIITISNPNPIVKEGALAGIYEILKTCLLTGDVATRYSPDIICLLLSGSNYRTAQEAFARIRDLFYAAYPVQYFGFYAKFTDLYDPTTYYILQPYKVYMSNNGGK